jgi:hypothetical protein
MLDHLHQSLHLDVHLQNGERNNIVHPPAVATLASSICGWSLPMPHTRDSLSISLSHLHSNSPLRPTPPRRFLRTSTTPVGPLSLLHPHNRAAEGVRSSTLRCLLDPRHLLHPVVPPTAFSSPVGRLLQPLSADPTAFCSSARRLVLPHRPPSPPSSVAASSLRHQIWPPTSPSTLD